MDSRYAPITFQQIDVFLSAAKYENFTKAASELNMTQASVSRNIAALEESLGIILFVRYKRRVHLTNTGKYFAKEMEQLSKQVDKVLDKSYELQSCQYNTIKIGDYNSTPPGAYLLPVMDAFEKKYPQIESEIMRKDPLETIDDLLSGQTDIIFSSNSSRSFLEKMNMEFEELFQLSPCLVISSRHSLFKKKQLSFKNLQGCRIIVFQGSGYSPYNEFVLGILQKYGFGRDNMLFVDNPHTMLMELQRKDSVAFMDEFYCPISKENLRYIELPGCEPVFGFGVAWSQDNQNPNIQKFVSCAKKLYKKS